MQITGYKRVLLPVLVAGAAFWAWHATRGTTPGAATPSSEAGSSTATPTASAPAGAGTPVAGAETPVPLATAPPSAPPPASTTAAPSPVPPPPMVPGGPSPAVPPAAPAPANSIPEDGLAMAGVQQDLGQLQFVFRDFRQMLGGNPVGNNAEIIKALLGRNPKKVVMKLWDGHRLNAEGELIDPWDTPYFFHQLSGQQMEIRCAGPDRVMWNKDDIQVQ